MPRRPEQITSQYRVTGRSVRRHATSQARKDEFLNKSTGPKTARTGSASNGGGEFKSGGSAASTKWPLATEKKKKGKKPTTSTEASGSAAEYFEPDPGETSQQEQDGTQFGPPPMSQEVHDEQYSLDCETMTEGELTAKYGPPGEE